MPSVDHAGADDGIGTAYNLFGYGADDHPVRSKEGTIDTRTLADDDGKPHIGEEPGIGGFPSGTDIDEVNLYTTEPSCECGISASEKKTMYSHLYRRCRKYLASPCVID